jgi:hypothetical protein
MKTMATTGKAILNTLDKTTTIGITGGMNNKEGVALNVVTKTTFAVKCFHNPRGNNYRGKENQGYQNPQGRGGSQGRSGRGA